MNTNDDAWKIDAFVDGELDLAGQLDIEQRMARDDEVRRQVETLRALSVSVREKADRHEAPPALRDRMRASARAARPEVPPAVPRLASARGRLGAALAPWLGGRPLVTSLAAAVVLAVTLNGALLQSSRQERLMDEAVASHVRSTFGPHVVDVLSSDHHTVKPYLSSKLGFSPPVPALPLTGSVLVGGRVDYLDGRPVAALVYRQGEHLVNSFVWPDAGGDSTPEFAMQRGYRIAHWSQGGMHHCVISDVNAEEFRRLVDAVRKTT